MKAVILGATGLVGGTLVRQLVKAEHITEIIALSRRKIHFGFDKVKPVMVDFDHLEASLKGIEADVLFSCLGTTKKTAGSIEAQRTVDLYYQLRTAEILSAQGVKHYFLVSSSGANSRSSNPYLKMKGELEEQVKKLPFETRHILQPSLLQGPRDEFRLGERLAGWLMPLVTWIPRIHHLRAIHVDDVAKKMIQLSAHDLGVHQTHALQEVFPK